MADSGCLDCDRANIGVVWWPGFELFSRPSEAERCRCFLASFSFQFPTLNISPPTHNSLHFSPKVVLQRVSAFSVGAQHEAERKVCKSSSLLFWACFQKCPVPPLVYRYGMVCKKQEYDFIFKIWKLFRLGFEIHLKEFHDLPFVFHCALVPSV